MFGQDIIAARQQELGLQLKPCYVLGCGGVGAWVALELALAGIPELVVSDPDKLEPHNLNRLPYGHALVGWNKAHAIKDFVFALRPDLPITAIEEAITPAILDMTWNNHHIIDCTDDFDSQRANYLWAREHGAPYLRCGVNTNHLTIAKDVIAYRLPGTAEQECGVTIPSWVAPCVLAASYAVAHVLLFPDLTVSMELGGEK